MVGNAGTAALAVSARQALRRIWGMECVTRLAIRCFAIGMTGIASLEKVL